VESIKERSMNIQWVLADNLALDPTADLARMRKAGAFWGSWKTWRAYNTDNVICHDFQKAQELVKRDFQSSCNFYIPNKSYEKLDSPRGIKLYEGDFMGHDVECQDEIVAMNLAASIADVVLLIGFDWREKSPIEDKILELRAKNYRGLVLQAIKSAPNTQWILVSHPGEVNEELALQPNLGRDSLSNVFSLLGG
jgi:hypothetical protein